MSSLLEVKNLSVGFSGEPIIENVSFSLNEGEVLSIIGPNGAGKTTLVKSILGLIPHKGDAFYLGKPVAEQLKHLGYVPQRFDFDKTFPLTVKEFLGLINRNIDTEESKSICSHLEIDNLINQKIGTLSGGQMQRVLIARAVTAHPGLIIMDEPTAGVDIGGVRSFYDIVRHLNKEHNMAVILISHEINMVYDLAQKVICLNKEMFCVGSPRETITKEILDKLYGKNVGPHKHIHTH